MGDVRQELQASCELILEYAREKCPESLKPDVADGATLVLAATDLLDACHAAEEYLKIVATWFHDKLLPMEPQQLEEYGEALAVAGSKCSGAISKADPDGMWKRYPPAPRGATENKTMTTPISEREREEWPADRGTGGFSKPASKVKPTIDEAIAACNCPTYSGDFIVIPITRLSGYQVWMRRANARGALHPFDYVIEATGRRAKKHTAGSGRLFILESLAPSQ